MLVYQDTVATTAMPGGTLSRRAVKQSTTVTTITTITTTTDSRLHFIHHMLHICVVGEQVASCWSQEYGES